MYTDARELHESAVLQLKFCRRWVWTWTTRPRCTATLLSSPSSCSTTSLTFSKHFDGKYSCHSQPVLRLPSLVLCGICCQCFDRCVLALSSLQKYCFTSLSSVTWRSSGGCRLVWVNVKNGSYFNVFVITDCDTVG